MSWTMPIDLTEEDENDVVEGGPSLFRDAPKSVAFAKLRKRLVRQTRAALEDFGMIRQGDRWLVCLSGGKDSYAMLAVLLDLKWRGLLPVDLIACNLDQAQPGFPVDVMPRFFESVGVPYRIERQDTYSVVVSKVPAGRTYCALCSRLRRGHLYRVAREEGCQAVVLGHHREDILETFFLNLFHGGKLATMPPKLVNEEGDLFLLRPLAYAGEDDIARFSALMQFPIIPCDLCGSQEGLQRNQIKAMLAEWEAKSPGRKETMLKALGQSNPSHLLDRALFDFKGLDIKA